MKKNKLVLIIGIIVTLIGMLLTFLFYKSNNALTIYAKDDSYAYKYAKNNMIKTFNLSDSHTKYFSRIHEDFKFNAESNSLIISKYEGISEELIIPTTYNKKKIIKIEKGALPSTVKKVFLPSSITSVDEEDFKDIEILCYRGKQCEDLKNNNKLKVTILDDVDRYVYYAEDIDFTYNLNNNEIELTNYIGDFDVIYIPETINGYKVTSMSFDGTGIVAMFIPNSVTKISGNITSKLFNKCFIISMCILLISLLTFIAIILIIKTNELMDRVYIYGTSFIYIGIINYIVIALRSNPVANIKYLVYSVITTIIYILFSIILDIIIHSNKKYDQKIKHANDFIKEMNLLLQDKDYDELKEISEMIKYSDPISIDEVKDIEKDIKETIKSIDDKNLDDSIKELKKLIKKRNTIIKDNK